MSNIKNDFPIPIWGLASIATSTMGVAIFCYVMNHFDKNMNGSYYAFVFGFLNLLIIYPFTLYWDKILLYLIPLLSLLFGCIGLTKRNLFTAGLGVSISAVLLVLSSFTYILGIVYLSSTDIEYKRLVKSFAILYLSDNFKDNCLSECYDKTKDNQSRHAS